MTLEGRLALALLEGVVTGCVLALTALGLSLIFGVMRIVNVAHGEFFMLGAVVAWSVASETSSFGLALLAAPAAAGGVALLANRLLLRPVRYEPHAVLVVEHVFRRFSRMPRPSVMELARTWEREGRVISRWNDRSFLG